MSAINFLDLIRAITSTPGQNAGIYREALQMKERVVGRALRAAEKLGLVFSYKVEGHRVWFPVVPATAS